MSRQRRALVSAFLTYCQWAASIGTSLAMARIVIRALGQGTYGLWLAASGLLGYAALSDLGLLSVLPWLVAAADGRKDQAEIRRLTSSGLAVGAAVGAFFTAVAGALWVAAPWLLKVSPAERELVFVPFAALVVLTALGYPLRAAMGVLQGLQDVTFVGALTALQPILNLALVLVFLARGQGLLGLALGAAVPPLLAGVAFFWRLWRVRPDLFRLRELEWLGRERLAELLGGGLGAWLGSLGWQLAFSSDAVILAYLGYRDAVTVFAITSRLGLTLMQMSWTLPDAGLVGLSQLHGEAPQRVGDVVAAMARLYLLLAGGVACAVLSLNAVFVRAWVGAPLFGGQPLNAALAGAVISLSLVHAVAVPAAVLGNRLRLGIVTALNGVAHVALAIPLGAWLGPVGIALATAIAGLITTLPVGLKLLPRFSTSIIGAWLWRFAPLAALAAAVGWADARLPAPAVIGLAALVGAGYLVAMRPLLHELPLGSRLRRALQAARLVPRS
ncbi:MAG TPA: hypothetical protein VFA20_18425 [Myxococcaceae bacterium]|nr:hypothetical protein [Myxococcaceae bacterium]